MNDAAPQLLALDWGTSSLRAFAMREGRVVDERSSAHGIQHLPQPGAAGFAQAFGQIAGEWLEPGVPVVACGMVGSAQGWREVPYVRCPADVAALAASATSVPAGAGIDLLIAPGVMLDDPAQLPDVMRGEETQVAGALRLHPALAARACVVLPGTHSKWVQVDAGRIETFASHLTGEMFAVLRRHSILGRLMPPPEAAATVHDEAFAIGLEAARKSRPGELLHQVFAARTLGLAGRLPHEALPDFLSGLLIGHELVAGLAAAEGAPLVLVGDAALCARYARALSAFGRDDVQVLPNTAPQGLWDLAAAAGLLS